MKLKLLTESEFDTIKYTEELCEKTNSKNVYIEGITLQGNVKNRNNRIYPSEILDEAVTTYINTINEMQTTMEGELKHPKENAHEINEDRISHRFVEVKKDGENWRTKALILNTPQGQQIKNLLEGGVKLGISSRMLGQVKPQNGVNYVQKGLKVVTLGDVVKSPSAPDAMIDAIYENKEYIFQNGLIVEKDLSEDLDNYKKLINTTKKEDRAKIFESIFNDYLKKIKLSL